MSKIDWIKQEIEGLQNAGLYNRIRTIESAQGAWLVVDGKKVLNFCSNNYLGLANHPKLVAAAQQAVQKYGVGPAAVRSIAGTMGLHLELERRLAAFKGVEAAITFQSGFNANLATIPALVGREDVIFSDRLNHASIIDGCRLSGAKIIAYEHCDAGALETIIQENLAQHRRAIVITDGVFSMDGDVAPLPEIYAVARKHDLLLMVDDAHGEGVLGRGGRGIVDHFNLHGKWISRSARSPRPSAWWGVWWRAARRSSNGCASAAARSCSPPPSPSRMRPPAWPPSISWRPPPNWWINCGKIPATSRPG